MSTYPAHDHLAALRDLVAGHLRWAAWEDLIEQHGITIDRPHGSSHPVHTSIIYPIDYGYVQGTLGSDGHELDVFVGAADTGLVGALLTADFRKGDREVKLLHDCTPEDVYLVNGFVNYDRRLMEGILVLRRPLSALWDREAR